MTHKRSWALAFLFFLASLFTSCFLTRTLYAQIDTIVIPAGTPEDNELNGITNEHDAQKKVSMYQDFLQKYASRPGRGRLCQLATISALPEHRGSTKGAGMWRQSDAQLLRTIWIFSLRKSQLRSSSKTMPRRSSIRSLAGRCSTRLINRANRPM